MIMLSPIIRCILMMLCIGCTFARPADQNLSRTTQTSHGGVLVFNATASDTDLHQNHGDVYRPEFCGWLSIPETNGRYLYKDSVCHEFGPLPADYVQVFSGCICYGFSNPQCNVQGSALGWEFWGRGPVAGSLPMSRNVFWARCEPTSEINTSKAILDDLDPDNKDLIILDAAHSGDGSTTDHKQITEAGQTVNSGKPHIERSCGSVETEDGGAYSLAGDKVCRRVSDSSIVRVNGGERCYCAGYSEPTCTAEDSAHGWVFWIMGLTGGPIPAESGAQWMFCHPY
ncbi:hypothetical protein B0J11DRAFT_599136 [Dendryphion nanum]|uniref:Uncharacterized protein n=1 Tax=Dendryphion nanum TaxID=256645 RepID=A0A9P9D190_9PLEO|nr:hypothetical protein B0J11DRAFT_599136 [Dendryphion nanum]